MSIGPNSASNYFVFNLPVNFFPSDIEAKWMKVLKKNKSIYSNIQDYINSTIKGIKIPGINYEKSEQVKTRGKKIKWKSAQNINDTYNDSIDITFSSRDFHLNYIIIHDILKNHYMNTTDKHLDTFGVLLIDRSKDIIVEVKYKEIIFTSLSEMEFNNNDTGEDEKTFTVSFEYNFIDYDYILDNPYDTDNMIDGVLGKGPSKIVVVKNE